MPPEAPEAPEAAAPGSAPLTLSPARTPTGPLGYDAWRGTRFFACLDGLRALSILAVVWHHSGGDTAGLLGLTRGFLGVDVFFAISGFLIVTLLLRERDRRGRISLRGFYARRSLRIFPVYYAFLAAVALLYVAFKPEDPTTGRILSDLPWAALYLSNLVPATAGVLAITWSLSTEEQFYLVWAPAEKFLKPVLVHALLGGVILGSLAVNFGFFDGLLAEVYGVDPATGGPRLLPLFGTTLLPMALGVVLAHAMHRPRGFAAVRAAAGFPAAPALFAAALLGLVLLVPVDPRGWLRPLIHVAILALLAALLLRDAGPVGRALRWKPLARVGVVSYGLYLFHKPVTVAAEGAFAVAGLPGRDGGLLGRVLLTAAVMALTWLVAEASFRFFETPFLRLKKRFEATPAGASDPR